MPDKACVFCFDLNRVGEFVQCSKCKEQFHKMCVEQCVNQWINSGKRMTTWKCDSCDTSRRCDHTPCSRDHLPPATSATTCDCKSNMEIVEVLSRDLENANREIKELKEEIDRLKQNKQQSRMSWSTVKGSSDRNKSYAEVVGSLLVSNRFSALAVDENPTTNLKDASTGGISSSVKPTRVQDRRKKRVLVVTDSHGRDCGSIFKEELGENFQCQVMCHPGAPFHVVARSAADQAASCRADSVVVLGGTNDFMGPDHLPQLDTSPLLKIPVSTSVFISHVPFRFDNTKYNRNIDKLNKSLDLEVKQKMGRCHLQTINLNSLNYRDHTKHGLHLNKRVKSKLCRIIASKIKLQYDS